MIYNGMTCDTAARTLLRDNEVFASLFNTVFFDGEEVIDYKTLVSYENDQLVLIDHQDIKRRRDIVKKARWDELARYDDMKKELDAQLAEAKMKAAEAETKAKAEFVLKLFKSKYLRS